MKKTAVEWMFNEITLEFTLKGSLSFMDLVNITQLAKEMEKGQMIDFALLFANSDSVYIEYDCEDCPAELTIERPDRLFELTYGGNK
jgi:hypothetical protein